MSGMHSPQLNKYIKIIQIQKVKIFFFKCSLRYILKNTERKFTPITSLCIHPVFKLDKIRPDVRISHVLKDIHPVPFRG